MVGLQQAAGLILVLFGAMAFLDRHRPTQARQSYYLYDPRFGLTGRSVSAVILVVAGFALLFSA